MKSDSPKNAADCINFAAIGNADGDDLSLNSCSEALSEVRRNVRGLFWPSYNHFSQLWFSNFRAHFWSFWNFLNSWVHFSWQPASRKNFKHLVKVFFIAIQSLQLTHKCFWAPFSKFLKSNSTLSYWSWKNFRGGGAQHPPDTWNAT